MIITKCNSCGKDVSTDLKTCWNCGAPVSGYRPRSSGMKKVSIVGVEGSGKTVMLAGLGELYSRPDEEGYFLSPKNFATARYVGEKIAKMRKGEWPVATPEDLMQGLDWTLRKKVSSGKPEDVCSISCLDFAGEVYRSAFCSEDVHDEKDEEITLKHYIDKCDDLIVLINLRDVITNGTADKRTQESIWITNAILNYALGDSGRRRKSKRAAIVLSQSDSYMDIIKSCGGARGVLEKYLPQVYHSYDWLDIFDACAVDLVRIDNDGNIFPHPDFQPTLLTPIVEWIRMGVESEEQGLIPTPSVEPTLSVEPTPSVGHLKFFITASLVVEGLFFSWIFVGPGFWRFVRWVLFLVVSFCSVMVQLGGTETDSKNERELSIAKSGQISALITVIVAVALTVTRFVFWIIWD